MPPNGQSELYDQTLVARFRREDLGFDNGWQQEVDLASLRVRDGKEINLQVVASDLKFASSKAWAPSQPRERERIRPISRGRGRQIF